jgi:hypothetical protein
MIADRVPGGWPGMLPLADGRHEGSRYYMAFVAVMVNLPDRHQTMAFRAKLRRGSWPGRTSCGGDSMIAGKPGPGDRVALILNSGSEGAAWGNQPGGRYRGCLGRSAW